MKPLAFPFHIQRRTVLIGAMVLLTAALAAPVQAWADGPIGTVAKKRMDVYGTLPDDTRSRLFPNYDVYFGERIETSGGAAVLLRLNDDTELFLGERASMVIDDFVYDPATNRGRAIYEFTVGTLRFVSGDMSDDGVTINTPNAAIGIRGSEAIIFVTPEGETIVNVRQGAFAVRSRARADVPAVTVNKDEHVSLKGDADFSPVGAGIKLPKYEHEPAAKVPDFSDDFRDLREGGGLDRAREGTDAGTRSDSTSDGHNDGEDHHHVD